jgi:GTP cyclohydrolase IV
MAELAPTHDDVQARRPSTHVSLTRVGVTGVEKFIRIGTGDGEQLYHAELECFVDLGPLQKGAHMSRFEEVVNEAIDEVVLGEALKAETLAQQIAERVRDRQEALRAEVRIAATYPEYKTAPESGSATQEIYRVFGTAVASARGTRRLIGVEAHGMTVSAPMRSSASSARCPSRRTTSAASDGSTWAAPRDRPPASKRRTSCGSSRSR